MEDEDATLLAGAQRQDDAPFRSPIWLTDGIRLSKRVLNEIASNVNRVHPPHRQEQSRETPYWVIHYHNSLLPLAQLFWYNLACIDVRK